MIQAQTVLDVADNTGAKKVMCVKVLGGTRRRYASVGDVIVVSIKEAIPNAKVKKGELKKAVMLVHKGNQKESSLKKNGFSRFSKGRW